MSKVNLGRRKFLGFAGGGIGVAALAGITSWKFSDEKSIVVSILKNKLGRLDIDEKSFEDFSVAYIEFRRKYKKQLRVLGVVSPIYTVVTPYEFLPMGHPLKKLENNVVSNFLLSTDFFQNNADTARKVNYLGFHNPYKAPCRNFFG